MNQQNFSQNKNEAIKRMREMQNKSIYKTEEKTVSKEPEQPKPSTEQNLLGGFNLPFLENLKSDSDLTLILGILLLLLSEKADKRLLFALIYILL